MVTVTILSFDGVNLNQIPLTALLTPHVLAAVKSGNAPIVLYPFGVALLVIAMALAQSSFAGRAKS